MSPPNVAPVDLPLRLRWRVFPPLDSLRN